MTVLTLTLTPIVNTVSHEAEYKKLCHNQLAIIWVEWTVLFIMSQSSYYYLRYHKLFVIFHNIFSWKDTAKEWMYQGWFDQLWLRTGIPGKEILSLPAYLDGATGKMLKDGHKLLMEWLCNIFKVW